MPAFNFVALDTVGNQPSPWTKIGIVLLACLVMILLACSPEAPAAETDDGRDGWRQPSGANQRPACLHSARHGSTSAPSCGVYRDDRISGANDDTPLPTFRRPHRSCRPHQRLRRSLDLLKPPVPTVSPAPGADAVPTILLVLTMAEVPAELPVYSRDDWRHWIGEDGDCQDPRNEVLLASSLADVAYRSDRRCRVASGQWFAPYSGTLVTVPGELDIDHMVSLADAHRSGAWQWSPELKRLYANYLDDPNHLIAVTARANRSKGARGPEEWKPPDRSYWCRYAVDWTTIKHKWDLTATPAEFAALDGMLKHL